MSQADSAKVILLDCTFLTGPTLDLLAPNSFIIISLISVKTLKWPYFYSWHLLDNIFIKAKKIRDSNITKSQNKYRLVLKKSQFKILDKVEIFPLYTVEKFKFSEFLLDDENGTYLSSLKLFLLYIMLLKKWSVFHQIKPVSIVWKHFFDLVTLCSAEAVELWKWSCSQSHKSPLLLQYQQKVQNT